MQGVAFGQSLDAAHIGDTLQSFSQNILGFVQTLYQSVVSFVLVVRDVFLLFYFLIDGQKMVSILWEYTLRMSMRNC